MSKNTKRTKRKSRPPKRHHYNGDQPTCGATPIIPRKRRPAPAGSKSNITCARCKDMVATWNIPA